MTFNLRINLSALFILFAALPIFATNIAIIESQSFHPLQTMDETWKAVADGMEFQSDILPQSTLNHLSNLANYDVLIVSSGLITTTEDQKATIEAFLQSGRNVYIQSEFSVTHCGNITFSQIVNNNGGSFEWLGAVSGSIAPVSILPPFNEGNGTVDALFYFWYGTYGSGDATVTSFIEGQDKSWGFVFNSPNQDFGFAITTADQDWIRIQHSNILMENILLELTFQPVVITPTVFIDQTITPICVGETYEFSTTITDSIPEITLQWQVNGQPIIGENQSTFTTSILSDGDVVECLLNLNNNNQNYQHVSNPILIAPVLPLAEVSLEIAASEILTCANETIILTATGENWGDQPSFTWSINGVEIPLQNDPIFTTTAAANQNITCTVISNAICTNVAEVNSNTITIDTIVTTLPTVNIGASETEICAGSLVNFSATGNDWNPTTNIQWILNGTTISTDDTFSSDLLEDGQTVTALLSQTNECGDLLTLSTNTITISVVDQVSPTVAIYANLSEACPGETIIYTATGNHWGEDPQLKWMVNGVTIITSGSSEFAYGQSTTNQLVSCEIISSESCVAANNIISNIVSIPSLTTEEATLAIEADNPFVCNGSVVNFRALGDHWGDTPSFEWSVNGTVINTSSAFYSAANLTTGSQVSCRLITDKPCVGITTLESNMVNIEASNFQLELVEKADATCGNDNGLIEFAIEGGLAPYRIQWNNGLTENFGSELAPGVYEILALDASGCTAELEVTIEGIMTPQIENLQIQNATCVGSFGGANFEMTNPTQDYTYRWVNEQNFILSDSTRLTNARAGDYTLLVTDPNGCTAEQTITIVETVEIEAEIITEPIITLGEEATLSLDVFANSPISIAWKDSSLLSCNDCFETSLIPTESRIYTAVLTSQEGCQVEVSQSIKIEKTKELHIPNAFSPNGDGVNDFFTVFGGTSYVRNIKSLQIFNRWGATVFSKNNLEVNDEFQGWDGRIGSIESDMGVYIYVAEIEFIDGETKMMTGDVSLIK